METLWGFSWWLCLVPLAVFGLAVVACLFMATRRAGACGAGVCCAHQPEPGSK